MQSKHTRQLLPPMAQTPPDSDTCPQPNWELGPSCSSQQEAVKFGDHSQRPQFQTHCYTPEMLRPVMAPWGPDSQVG